MWNRPDVLPPPDYPVVLAFGHDDEANYLVAVFDKWDRQFRDLSGARLDIADLSGWFLLSPPIKPREN